MSEFKQGFRPLTAATIGNMCGALTITTYTQSFFVGPVTEEFGWSTGQFFVGFMITSILGIFTAPLAGSLALKYGIRILGMIGLTGHAICYILLSLNPNSLILWFFTWGLFSILTAGALPIIWTSVLNSWFFKNRGKAIGITMASSGVAAFILPPLVEFLIDNHGWRAAYRTLGISALIISLPIVYLWFKEKTAAEISKNPTAQNAKSWGMTRNEAIKTLKFWNLAAVLFCTVFVVVGLLANFGPIFSSIGVERETIAILAAIMGATVIVGRLLAGALVDKFWAPGVGCVFFSILIVALICLVSMPFSMPLGIGVALAIGLAAGSELDLLAFLTSKYFGPKHYSAIFGGIFAIFGMGAGLGPPIFGEIATRTGSYDSAIYLAIVFLLIAIPLFFALGRYPEEAIKEVEHT